MVNTNHLFLKIFLSITVLFLISCKAPSESCSPNFVQGGFGAKVTYVSGNDFLFEVCYNDQFLGTQITVYGFESEYDIPTLNLIADARLPHMTDGLFPGDTFTVTFNDDDSWFAIFADDNLGNSDNTTQILKGQIR